MMISYTTTVRENVDGPFILGVFLINLLPDFHGGRLDGLITRTSSVIKIRF